MFVAEPFLYDVVEEFGQHPVSTDGERTWYLQAYQFQKLKHHLHSSFEKSIIERTMQYVKIESKKAWMTTFHVERKSVN
jgi:putative transposase